MSETETGHLQDQIDQERATDEGMPEPPGKSVVQKQTEAPPAPTAETTQFSPAASQEVPPAPVSTAEAEQKKAELLHKNKEAAERMMRSQIVARMDAATADPKALDPNERFDAGRATATAEQAAHKKPADIPKEAIEKMSLEERKQHTDYEGWENGLRGWIKKNREHANNPNNEEIKAALSSLGIDASKGDDELNEQIRDFHAKYLEEKADIEGFAGSLAEGCREDGIIDLTKVEQRLDVAQKLFKVFGEKGELVNQLARGYATTYALRSAAAEQNTVRDTVKEKTIEQLQSEPTGEERTRLQALWETRQSMLEEGNRRQRVRGMLENARGEAEATDTTVDAHDEEAKLKRQKKNNEISVKDFEAKMRGLREKEKGIVTLDTPEELHEALRQTQEDTHLSDEELQQTFEHEMDHYRAALDRQAKNVHFRLQASKQGDGTNWHASTGYTLDMPEGEEKDRIDDEILMAPGFDDLESRRGVGPHDLKELGIDKESVNAAKNEGLSESAAIVTRAREIISQRGQQSTESPDDDNPDNHDEPGQITPEGELDVNIGEIARSLTEEEIKQIHAKLQNAANDALTMEEYVALARRRDEILMQGAALVAAKHEAEGLDDASEKAKQEKEELAKQIGPELAELSEKLRKGKETFDNPDDIVKALLILRKDENEIRRDLAGLQKGLDVIRDEGGIPLYDIQLVKITENGQTTFDHAVEVRPKPTAA